MHFFWGPEQAAEEACLPDSLAPAVLALTGKWERRRQPGRPDRELQPEWQRQEEVMVGLLLALPPCGGRELELASAAPRP
jgi:hypothetical protein